MPRHPKHYLQEHLLSLELKGLGLLFPKIDNRFTQENLATQSIRNEEVKSDTTIRDIFKKAFEDAGYEYIKPHSFRKTLARYAKSQTPAFLNAVRQNLGHSSTDTTLSSYGQLSMAEQRKNIASVKFGEER
jgi:integrase